MNKKGLQQNINFKDGKEHLADYIEQVANLYHGGNISAAIMDAIECHQRVSKIYGDWRQIDEVPFWLPQLMERLKSVKVNGDDQEETVEKALEIGNDLFE